MSSEDGFCHPYQHVPGCDCFDHPQERNPIQSPSLQEIQRRDGVGAAEAMRRQAFDRAHGFKGAPIPEKDTEPPTWSGYPLTWGDE